MSSKRASLWDAIPASVRLQLIPILTTLALVKAGRSTAELLTRLREGKPFCKMSDGTIPPACAPNEMAITDLQGILLMLNFVVILWFTRLGLKDELDKPGAVKTSAQIVGLGTAFATSLELYDYATKAGHPERIIFTLLILLFVFIVPFFLIKGSVALAGPAEGGRDRRVAMQALASFELLTYAIVPCVVSALVCSLYYVVLNEGIVIWGHSLVPAFIDTIRGPYGRVEFWGFNPGMLGVCWLSVVTIFAVWEDDRRDVVLSLDRPGKILVLLATLAIGALMGLFLIGSSSVVPRPEAVGPWRLRVAKALMAMAVLIAFLVAFLGSRVARRLSTAPALLLQVLLFAAAGSAAGLFLVWSRTTLADGVQHARILIAMHAAGFAVSLLAGRLGLAMIERRLPAVQPVLGQLPQSQSGPLSRAGEAIGFDGWT